MKYKPFPTLLLITVFSCIILTACKSGETADETSAPETEAPVTQTAEIIQTPTPTPEPTPEPTFPIETGRQDAIYNESSKKAAYLHMDRAELEAVLKPGATTESGFVPYDNGGFFVKYYGNDTIKELVVTKLNAWQTYGGIHCGSSLDELLEVYGEPLDLADNTYTYYTLDNELLSELPSLTEVDINFLYTLRFTITDNVVTSIMLIRF